ncbi:unnamed protein product [Cylicocyclus nassatus]|uniref:Uncharacterized protein n=1 Tax=Cylicocyclus nassatus TaxID=53992 RepID=A0AA36GXY8_CYLNA|nr:unnamed protein product [Cylicocyclus nassatus]
MDALGRLNLFALDRLLNSHVQRDHRRRLYQLQRNLDAIFMDQPAALQYIPNGMNPAPDPDQVNEPYMVPPNPNEAGAMAQLNPNEAGAMAPPNPDDAGAGPDLVAIQENAGGEPNPNGIRVEPIVELGRQDKLLFFACYTVIHATTFEELKRLILLIEVVSERTSDISALEIRSFLEELTGDLNTRSYFFCNSCHHSLIEQRSLCDNPQCELRGKHPKRSNLQRRATLSLLDVRPQIETVLTKHLSLLLSIHRRLHEDQIDHGWRSQPADYPEFKRNCESSSDFHMHKITVQLTLATDGFTPSRLNKQELWPLYIRVDDFPQKIGNNYSNIVLAGILRTTKTPTEILWEGLWNHLVAELSILNANEFLRVRDRNGDMWTVSLRLVHGVVDYQGLKDIFGIPCWNSYYGCHKCLYRGNRQAGTRALNWYCANPQDCLKRTSENILRDAERRANGLNRGRTSAMTLFTPAMCCADALHVISEGVTQDRLRDLLSRSSKLDGMRLARETIAELRGVLAGVRNYTYSPKFILGFEDLPSMTGAEVEMLANIIFPLVGAAALCPSPLCTASLVGYWYCIKELQAVEDLTTVNIEFVQTAMCLVKQLWHEMSDSMFTLKAHNLFDHCVLEEVELYGSPYVWSAAPFESIHRILQVPHNQYVSNSNDRILNRFVQMKKLAVLMEEAFLRNHSGRFESLLGAMKNEAKRRAKIVIVYPGNENIAGAATSQPSTSGLKSYTYAELSPFSLQDLDYAEDETSEIPALSSSYAGEVSGNLSPETSMESHYTTTPEVMTPNNREQPRVERLTNTSGPIEAIKESLGKPEGTSDFASVLYAFFSKESSTLNRASVEICDPPYEIWDYTYRAANSPRADKRLINLPEGISHTITEFIIDAVGLSHPYIYSGKLASLRNSRERFWLALGDTEENRETRFKQLLRAKTTWFDNCKTCMTRSLEDIRSYRMHDGQLVAPKKYKATLETGLSRQQTAEMSSEEREQALQNS